MLEHFLNGLGDYPSEYQDDDARAGGKDNVVEWGSGNIFTILPDSEILS